MARRTEIKLVARLLADEGNAEKSAEEVAETVLDSLDDHRGKTRRFVTIFQAISQAGPGWPFVIDGHSTYLQALNACEMPVQTLSQLSSVGITPRRMVGITVPTARWAAELYLSEIINAKKDAKAERIAEWLKQNGR